MEVVSKNGGGVKEWRWCQRMEVLSRNGGGVKEWGWCQGMEVVLWSAANIFWNCIFLSLFVREILSLLNE